MKVGIRTCHRVLALQAFVWAEHREMLVSEAVGGTPVVSGHVPPLRVSLPLPGQVLHRGSGRGTRRRCMACNTRSGAGGLSRTSSSSCGLGCVLIPCPPLPPSFISAIGGSSTRHLPIPETSRMSIYGCGTRVAVYKQVVPLVSNTKYYIPCIVSFHD